MPVEKTREEFIVWIRLAMNDRESGAYEQLYQFLWNCFCRADVNNKGKIEFDQFDKLIEEAAELPRLYGFAPTSSAMYSSDALRVAARKKLFKELDANNAGYVTVSQWIRYAIHHIAAKYVQLPKDYLSGSASGVSKDEFIAFVKRAVDPANKEYEELYYFLLRTFQAGDKNGYGEVEPAEFDEMVECAAEAPRKYGLAPATDVLYKNNNDRMMHRIAEFSKVDYHNQGYITFNEWLKYVLEHIKQKVSQGLESDNSIEKVIEPEILKHTDLREQNVMPEKVEFDEPKEKTIKAPIEKPESSESSDEPNEAKEPKQKKKSRTLTRAKSFREVKESVSKSTESCIIL